MKFESLGISKIAILIFLVVSLILVLVAFKDQKILAGGEEGLVFFNLQRSIELYKTPWFETGTGYPVAVLLPRVTILVIGFILNELGFEIWLIQAFIYFSLFFVGMIYVYLLTKELFKSKNIELGAILSGVFYLLNLYSFTQIWGRFLHAQFFAFALLPVVTFYSIKFLSNFKFYNLLFLNIFALYCSFAFGEPAQVFTIWTPSFLWVCYQIYKNFNNKKFILKCLGGFLIILTSWTIINFWWIYPYKSLINYTFSDVSNWKVSYDSLAGVSQYFSSDQILLLRQSFLFGEGGKYYYFYSSFLVKFLSILILFFAIFGVIKNRKEKNWLYLFLILFVGWFVSKGTNPPFGDVFFSFLFSKISFSQVLRNSYEKFGLVWMLAYSIFFGLGLSMFLEKIAGKGKYFIAIVLMFFFSVILVWPFWFGDLFDLHRISVPNAYQEINSIINKDTSESRILVLPIEKGDSSLLDWGYNGVEPSEYLFNKPVISKRIGLSDVFNNKYDKLVDALAQGSGIHSLLEEFNIKYIVIRHDFKLEKNIIASHQSEASISALPNIRFIERKDKLSLYEYESSKSGYFLTDDSKVKISYDKISPTKYIVNVRNSSGDFDLIFKETYSGGWVAMSGGELFKHDKIYDYANKWKINKSGDFQIEIIFKVWPEFNIPSQHP